MIQRFRIGNNLSVVWLLYEDDGNIHNLEGKEIELYMACGGYKYPVADYTVTENAVAWTFPAAMQTKTGYYKLVLLERDAVRGVYSFDVAEAFCLEPKDALTNIETIVDEDATVQVRSVLTYAHITNIASIDTVQVEGGYDAVIHLTNGKSFTIPVGAGGHATNIVDNLNSHSTDDALSANMGRVLKEMIQSAPGTTVEDNLVSVSKTNALSANMGRELKRLIDSIDTGGGGGGGSVSIVDNLTEGGRTKALSAEQGKVLKALIDAIPGSGSSDVAQTMYSSEADPGTPATDPGSWHSARQSGDTWLAIRFKEGANWGEWTVIFIGEIELPYATFKSFAFTRSNDASVSAPTGGSYASPVPTTTGWSDNIPSGTGKVWMSTRVFASDDTHSDVSWSTPREVADSEYMDYEFSSVANPGLPSKATPSSNNTNPNWGDTASESTIWMAMREVSNGLYKENSSWMVVKIKGEDGKDGSSVKIVGTLDSSTLLPNPYSGDVGDGYLIDGDLWVWDGDSWENVGQIKGEDGDDGQTPFLHIKYSNDGGLHFTGSDGEEPGDYIGLYWDYDSDDSDDPSHYNWKYWKGADGFGYEYIYKLTSTGTAPSLPPTSVDEDDDVPTGWTDDPGGVSAEYPFCWVAWRKKEDGHWSAWHGTSNNKARLFSHYGTDGEPGGRGQAQFKSIVFKRSATQPSRPGNSKESSRGSTPSTIEPNPQYGGTFSDPVPFGWSDGIPALESLSDPDSLENTLWMTSRVFTDDGLSPEDANWKTPVQAFDTDSLDVEFAYMQTNDARPADPTTANRHGGSGVQIWFDPYLDRYESGTTPRDFTEMFWMAIRNKVNGTGVGPWQVLRIKGEKGADGVDGKDAKPVRIRKWTDVAGQTLTDNQRVFSGYENGAPFRDVIIITKDVYPSGTEYPWTDQGNALPMLVTVNYNPSTYANGYPGSYFTNARLPQTGNFSPNLPASATESASATALGTIYSVFANLGAVYIQLLATTQAYIGGLTVDHLTTNAGNNSYIDIDDGFICFYDSNGNLRIKMGQGADDSSPVLRFFDTDGLTELYDLGPGGFVRGEETVFPPEWNRRSMYFSNSLFTVGQNVRLISPGNYYEYKDGYKITTLPNSNVGVRVYQDPFNPTVYTSSTPSELNGQRFTGFSRHLTQAILATLQLPDGYYMSEHVWWNTECNGYETEEDPDSQSGYADYFIGVRTFRVQTVGGQKVITDYDVTIKVYADKNTGVDKYEVYSISVKQ